MTDLPATPSLSLPEGLFGRKDECDRLVAAVDHAAGGGKSVVVLGGEAGIGKTALVRALGRLAPGATVVEGHHVRRGIVAPHGALVAALRSALQLLVSDQDGGSLSRMASELGSHGPILVSLMPELAAWVGDAAPVVAGPKGLKVLMHLAVAALVERLGDLASPLVLVLDDSQWADAASRELLLDLARAGGAYVIVVAARTDTPDADVFLGRVASVATEAGHRVADMRLGPLRREAVVRWVAEACMSTPSEVDKLAAELLGRTAGVPLFLREVLLLLHRDGQLDPVDGRWVWNRDTLPARDLGESALQLLLDGLRRLPMSSRDALGVGACIGPSFELSTLAECLGRPPEELGASLEPAVAGRAVEWQGDGRRLRFTHDEVRESARERLPGALRARTHLQLGRALEAGLGDPTTDRSLFEAVWHLSEGLAEMDVGDRDRLVPLCEAAAERLAGAASFEAATDCLLRARAALGPDGWERQYSLALAVHTRLAAVAYAAGQLATSEEIVATVMAQATDVADEADAVLVQMDAAHYGARFGEAIALADGYLEKAGGRASRPASPLPLACAALRVLFRLRGRGPTELETLPAAHDRRARARQRVAMRSATSELRFTTDRVPMSILRDVESVLVDGVTAEGAQAWTGLGILLVAAFGRLAQGVRFGELALRQIDAAGGSRYRPAVELVVVAMLRVWAHPWAKLTADLDRVQRQAVDGGDFRTVMDVSNVICLLQLSGGATVARLQERLEVSSAYRRLYEPSIGGAGPIPMHRLIVACARGEEGIEPMERPTDPMVEILWVSLEVMRHSLFGRPRRAFDLAMVRPVLASRPPYGALTILEATWGPAAILEGVIYGWTSLRDVRRPLRPTRRTLAWACRLRPEREWRLAWFDALTLLAQKPSSAGLEALKAPIEAAAAAEALQGVALMTLQAARIAAALEDHARADAWRDEAREALLAWGAPAPAAALA